MMLSLREPEGRFRKKDIVIGIMGKTQGVKIAAMPRPNASSRNPANPCRAGASGVGTLPGSA
jgi:hypothetical protein